MKTSERIEEEAHHSDCPAVDGFGCRCDELETKTEVWFGNMTHGLFHVGWGEEEPCVIVHSINEKRMMDLDKEDVNALIGGAGHDSYLIPSEFEGVIVYSKPVSPE
jgi:hypothetical protein